MIDYLYLSSFLFDYLYLFKFDYLSLFKFDYLSLFKFDSFLFDLISESLICISLV